MEYRLNKMHMEFIPTQFEDATMFPNYSVELLQKSTNVDIITDYST